MERTLLFSALLAACLAPAPAAADEVRSVLRELPLEGDQSIQVKIPVGQLLIEGTDGDSVRAAMSIRCQPGSDWCRQRSEKVDLLLTSASGKLTVEVDGLGRANASGIELSLQLEMPRDRALEVDGGVGDVRVRGVFGDVEIDLGVGDVEVQTSAQRLRSLELDTGVGSVRLVTDLGVQRGSGFVGSDLRWSHDQGEAHLEVDLGVGEIEVHLE